MCVPHAETAAMKNGITRRQVVAAIGTVAITLRGQEVTSADAQSRGLTISLDAMDAVVIQYRGRRVVLRPDEIMDALGAPVVPSPSQYPRMR